MAGHGAVRHEAGLDFEQHRARRIHQDGAERMIAAAARAARHLVVIENPGMPGVLVIEGIAQTACVLALRLMPPTERRRSMFFMTIDKGSAPGPSMSKTPYKPRPIRGRREPSEVLFQTSSVNRGKI
jgi:hypothetical protein